MAIDPKDFATRQALEELSVRHAEGVLRDLQAAAERVPVQPPPPSLFAVEWVSKSDLDVSVDVLVDDPDLVPPAVLLGLGEREAYGNGINARLTADEAEKLAEHLKAAAAVLRSKR